MHLASTILIVEDNKELRTLVAERLREDNYQVDEAGTGVEALEKVGIRQPDLVLLDVMLPELDGLEVCRRLRMSYPLMYIIMLTARSDELDRVVGLEVGADDYVTKPFSLQELVARVRAALRRIRLTRESALQTEEDGQKPPLVFGDLSLDSVKREIRKGGKIVHLTVREFDLLQFLAEHADRPFSRNGNR